MKTSLPSLSQNLPALFLAAGLWLAGAVTGAAQCIPVTITNQPRSVTNAPCATNCATFTVGATSSGTIWYQWFFESTSIPGATNASLTVCTVTATNAGRYWVRAFNLCSATNSALARLTVLTDTNAPGITCPSNITRVTCTSNRVQVFFPTPPATDDFDASPAVTCFPPTGSYFSIGAQVIRCTARDDCGNSNSCTFRVTVVRDTSPPAIAPIPDLSIPANTITPVIDVTVSDAETPPEGLTVWAESSNHALLPDENVTIAGSSTHRGLLAGPLPNQQGVTVITVKVRDGCGHESSTSFRLCVGAPSLSAIADQVTVVNTPVGPIPFTVSDAETAPEQLVVFGYATDPMLLPTAGIVFGGSGANRTVTLTPAPSQAGTTTVIYGVSDGTKSVTNSFTLTVRLAVLLVEPFRYRDGPLISNAPVWHTHSGPAGQTRVMRGKLQLSGSQTEDVSATLSNSPYLPGPGALYARFTVKFSELPSAAGNYFMHFKPDGPSDFRCRVFANTSGAAAGKFRLGLANGGDLWSRQFPRDLSLNSNYTVVVRYQLASAVSTIWLEPADESSPSVTVSDAATPAPVASIAFRQDTGLGVMTVDDVKIGATFPPPKPLNSPPTIDQFDDITVSLCGTEDYVNISEDHLTIYLIFDTDDEDGVPWELSFACNSSNPDMPAGFGAEVSPALGASGQFLGYLTIYGGKAGSTTITITVTDEDGATGSTSFVVKVRPCLRRGVYSVTGHFPPPNSGYYSAPDASSLTYSNGLQLRRLHLGRLDSLPLPAPGSNALFTGSSELQVEASEDGFNWTTHRAPAQLSLRVTGSTDATPNAREFDLEVLTLTATGGTIPTGSVFRVNPAPVSRGHATVRALTDDTNDVGRMVSGNFNLWTEISGDSGRTWSPASASLRIELTEEAPEETPATSHLPPPYLRYAMPRDAAVVEFTNAVGLSKFGVDFLGCPELGPFICGTSWCPRVIPLQNISFEVSVDGGSSFSSGHTTGCVQLAYSPAMVNGAAQFFDVGVTEFTATLPGFPIPPVWLRASPSRPSTGTATQRTVGDGYRVSGFVDLWLEASRDGGRTWVEANRAVRLVQSVSPDAVMSPTLPLPPPKAIFANPAGIAPIEYANGILSRRYVYGGFAEPFFPAEPVGETIRTTRSRVSFEVSTDGGHSFFRAHAHADWTVHFYGTPDLMPIRLFDVEVVRLDISGGDLPAGMRFRASPEVASRGRTLIASNDLTGVVAVSSFIDLWREVSRDDGRTWSPAVRSGRIELTEARLDFSRDARGVTVRWQPASFVLEQTSDLRGAWSSVPGAASPFATDYGPTKPSPQFWRVREP